MNKKVMVIGAGAGQVPIIELCKNRGLLTYVVSPDGPYPGIGLGDIHVKEDIYDVDKLVEIGRGEDIDYVVSDQSDFAVPIVAYIAERLGLPGNRSEVARTYSYKNLFRTFCRKNGIPSPSAIELSHADIIPQLKYPVVIKPADSQGSRGINKVENESEIAYAVHEAFKYSKKGTIVIEDFFPGDEIVCEGFAINGKYFPVAFGDRTYFKMSGKFIPSRTIFPALISDKIKKKLIENEIKITSELKPSFGIIHSEYLINKESGEIMVVESALRGGGVYIASDLIPLATGVNLTEVLFEAMMGNYNEAERLLLPTCDRAAAYVCFYLDEGVITDIIGEEGFCTMPQIIKAELNNCQVGSYAPKIEHKGMRRGPFIICADSLDFLYRDINKLQQLFSIKINGHPGIHWN